MRKDYDYNQPIKIGDGVFWIGFCDEETNLHCNPYLIVEGEEAVVIDGGSRPDFPKVMMKILKTGLVPGNIKALIYQHYDPDLCGSLPNFENIINSPELKILSTAENHMFISHYSVASNIVNLSSLNFEYSFKSGRKLKFIKTPFAHAAGSFVTYDERSKILFTSDIFGSLSKKWDLFFDIDEKCFTCDLKNICTENPMDCPFMGIFAFHRSTFPSRMVLEYAFSRFEHLDFEMIAPQHGSILKADVAKVIIRRLKSLDNIGIEKFVKNEKCNE